MGNDILQYTLLYAAPLIAAALGGMFSERSGVVNIGLEGMMTFGAFLGATTVYLLDQMGFSFSIAVGLAVACAAGMLFALLHAYLSISLKVDQIISGVVINMLALSLALYFTKVLFGVPETTSFSSTSLLVFDKINLITIIILLLAVVSHFILNKTRWGLRVLAVGENPQAADAMGINVIKTRYQAVILSGAFAGLAGMTICLNVLPQFGSNTVGGLGFIALAVLIFGRHNAFGVVFAALVFGYFKRLGIASIGAGVDITIPIVQWVVPNVVFIILPYVATIIVIFIMSRSKKTKMESLGIPYDKETR